MMTSSNDNTETVISDSDDIHRPLRPVKKRWRTFVAVSDGTPESDLAIRFAAMRASHVTGGRITLFHAIQPESFQHWMSVADRMRAEALAEAEDMLKIQADKIAYNYGVRPKIEIHEGEPHEVLADYIKSDPTVFALVLGAGDPGAPGPLIDYFAREVIGTMTCPVIIIPAGMTTDQIDHMA